MEEGKRGEVIEFTSNMCFQYKCPAAGNVHQCAKTKGCPVYEKLQEEGGNK